MSQCLPLTKGNDWLTFPASWATIAGGSKYGRFLGFVTGWINFYGWMFDLAALVQIAANISVNMYVVYHPEDYVFEAWHVYVAYLL